MNLLDALIGGIRKVFVRGVEAPMKNALDFQDMDVTPKDDRLVLSVSGVAGVPVSPSRPTVGQTLVFDGEKWVPGDNGAPKNAQYVVMHEHPDLTGAFPLTCKSPLESELDGTDASVYLDNGPWLQPQLLRWTGEQWSVDAPKPEITRASIMPLGSPLHTIATALEEIGAIKIV